MSIREYIGARYVPIFGRKDEESIQWDNTGDYEPLTIVLHQGNSYTSRQYVPIGIDITNEEYWALTGNYNAQVEQYRAEVQAFNSRINDNAAAISDIEDTLPNTDFSTTNTVKNYIDQKVTDINTEITGITGDIETLEDNINGQITTINDNITDVEALMPSSAFTSTNTIKKYIDDNIAALSSTNKPKVIVILGDSWSDGINDPNIPWYEIVKDKFNAEAVITAAVSAVGYAYGNTPIPEQVAHAKSLVESAGYSVNDVTHVVALGGVNDYRLNKTYPQVRNGIQNTYNNCLQTFPYAKISIICGTAGKWDTMDSLDSGNPDKKSNYLDYIQWMKYLTQYINEAGLPCVTQDVGAWLNADRGRAEQYYNSDNLHPTQAGHYVIAAYVAQIMAGTYEGISYSFTAASPTSTNPSLAIPISVLVNVSHGLCTMICEMLPSSVITTNTTQQIDFNMSGQMPLICGGVNNKGYRSGFAMPDFQLGDIKKGYYDAVNNRIRYYPGGANTGNLFFTTQIVFW